MRKHLGLSIIVALMLLGIAGVVVRAWKKAEPVVRPAATQPAGPNAVAPSASWLRDYEEYLGLMAELERRERESGVRELRDRVNGVAQRLRQQFPSGYDFDARTGHFERIPSPGPPVVSQPRRP